MHAAAERLAGDQPETSVRDAFAAALGDGFARHPFVRRFLTSVAAGADEVGVHALLGSDPERLIDDGGRLLGGNQSLATAMAEALGGAVRLSSPVVAVQLGTAAVTVVTAGGERIAGDELVIAVPLPLLDELGMDFALPQAIVEALAVRAMGDATKCAVALAADVDDPAVQSPSEFSWSWQSRDVSGTARVPALTGFTGGSSAARYAGPDGGDRWLDEVRALRGRLEASGDPLVTAWKHDPWARGAYSHPLPGWHPRDIVAFDEVIGGRLTFAGEYVSTAASLDGAASSGRAAAERLLRRRDARDAS